MKNLTLKHAKEKEEDSLGRPVETLGFHTQEIGNHQLAWFLFKVIYNIEGQKEYTEIRYTVFIDGRAATGGIV